jgi:hypothetical protein
VKLRLHAFRRLLASCTVAMGAAASALFCLSAAQAQQSGQAGGKVLDPVAALEGAVPRGGQECTAARAGEMAAAAEALERWGADLTWKAAGEAARFDAVKRLLDAKHRVDAALKGFLDIRGEFAAMPEGDGQRDAARRFLEGAATLTDLSGRMRYLLRDAIDNAAFGAPHRPERHGELIAMFSEKRIGIGAVVMSDLLFDPEPGSGVPAASLATKIKVLELIADCGQTELVGDLAELARDPASSPELVVHTAAAIRRLGVPQNARPGSGADLPPPAITAEELSGLLARLRTASLRPETAPRRDELVAWLNVRAAKGVVEESFSVGNMEIRPGDWILMRNPSPYNLFTDLSPGLFTHVGVVAVETGQDGLRRFVVVDLPERGAQMPATNLEAYLDQTLHFVFVRHPDAEVGRKMNEVAAGLIGAETQFDLLFRTDRVFELKGEPLAGKRIHTYCAGFLVLCAQETPAPLSDFFPLRERAAPGQTLANLNKLGMSIGENFVSPTGAFFSPRLEVVGTREPMYDPTREVKEAIYDHFAASMSQRTLVPSPTAYQLLREKLAEVSKNNSWLARALARANNVSEHMDLASAAKAAAVIETLDEIAGQSMSEFLEARAAMTAGPTRFLSTRQYTRGQLDGIRKYRARHADLYDRWERGQVSPRDMRLALVRYYVDQGKRHIDERFFPDGAGQP